MKKKIWDIYAPLYERFIPDVEKLGFSGGLTRDPNGFELEFLQYD